MSKFYYDRKQVQKEAREVLFDWQGQVCSLHDHAGAVIPTIEGDDDFALSVEHLGEVLDEVEFITGIPFSPAQVADPDRYLYFRASR